MAQHRARDTPSSNPHGTAPPTRHAQQQSPSHSATQATRPAAIPMAQRHLRDTPSSNPHGTAPPTTRPVAIPMAQRHPRDAPNNNPHGTAPPTRPAQQQTPWHSATHATHATRPRRRSAWHGINDAPRRDATRDDATGLATIARAHSKRSEHGSSPQTARL